MPVSCVICGKGQDLSVLSNENTNVNLFLVLQCMQGSFLLQQRSPKGALASPQRSLQKSKGSMDQGKISFSNILTIR